MSSGGTDQALSFHSSLAQTDTPPSPLLLEVPLMPRRRLILALHNRQPCGQLRRVFEGVPEPLIYLPFWSALGVIHPEIPFVLPTSVPLWNGGRAQPDYIERVRALVDAGESRILDGGSTSPILNE